MRMAAQAIYAGYRACLTFTAPEIYIPMTTQQEWNERGEAYARAVNEMVAFAEKEGWDQWTGPDPEDNREHLASEVIGLLKTANSRNEVESFREAYPPAHLPLIAHIEKQGQYLGMLTFIEKEKILFFSGTSYEPRKAYLLDGGRVSLLEAPLEAAGRSLQGNVFVLATADRFVTTQGWEGPVIREFTRRESAGLGITGIRPFNDGHKILLTTPEGIFLVSETEEQRIHPLPDDEDPDPEATDEERYGIDMENAALSHDNRYIVVADQDSDHHVLDSAGRRTGSVGPQSSYPHYCLFSADDRQLITNSCHFYNGITIGVAADALEGIAVAAYTESDAYTLIDEEMRVYAGVAVSDYYILGDAYGYIKAIGMDGKKRWRHFLGSTISGITVSDDGRTLWVGTYAGILHQLQLGKGNRDAHTIGNGGHYEDFRLLVWKEEPEVLRW